MSVESVTVDEDEILGRIEELQGEIDGEVEFGDRYRELRGRLKVWQELRSRIIDQRKAEAERIERARKTTRKEARELIQRLRDAPHSGPPTSQQAAEFIAREASNREAAIYTLLKMRPYGLTDQQIQQTLGLDPDTQRPGRWELSHRLDLVVESGRTRETDKGHEAIVWIAHVHIEDQRDLQLETEA